MNKPEMCTCIYVKDGFNNGEIYYFIKLDKGTYRVHYDYASSKDDYETMDSKNFHSRFKKVR